MSLDFQDRLRDAALISPSFEVVYFQVDTLEKKGGKKVSIQEIIDSDESVAQDQGNKTQTFPINAYFTGDDFDEQMSLFESALKERHTLASPSILQHPMWGDINVFPVTWTMKIELVKGVGVGRIDVEFVEIFPQQYPESTLNNSDLVSGNLDDMSFIDSAAQMITDTAAALSNIAGVIQDVVGVITTAVEFLEAIEETVEGIQNEINSMIDDIGGNISQLLFAVQRLQRLPSRIIDTTLNKISTYKQMCGDIIDAIKDDKETDPVNLKNNAVMMQTFAGFAVACMAEASLYTEFSIRTDTVATIESINEVTENYNAALAEARTAPTTSSGTGDVSKEYSGDHNFQLLLFDSVSRTNDILLNQAFDLKAEKIYVLENNSDIITECYNNYGKVDTETIEYFINTNNICCDEFCELPRGRQCVVYV